MSLQKTAPPPSEFSTRDPRGVLRWLSRVHMEGHGTVSGLDVETMSERGWADMEAAKIVFLQLVEERGWIHHHQFRSVKFWRDATTLAPSLFDLTAAPAWQQSCVNAMRRAHPRCPMRDCGLHHAVIADHSEKSSITGVTLQCLQCDFKSDVRTWLGNSPGFIADRNAAHDAQRMLDGLKLAHLPRRT